MRYWVHKLKCITFRSKQTLEELKTFQRNPNGTWCGKAGCLDDRVMSLVWALIILDSTLVTQYFEVLEYDENNKPKVIQLTEYGNNMFRGFDNVQINNGSGWKPPMPVFDHTLLGNNNYTEIDQLQEQGWEFL